MTTQNSKSGIIVAFHIGRGGRFWNAGHKTFIGEKDFQQVISENSDKLFESYENYRDLLNSFEGKENLSSLLENAIDEKKDAIKRLENWGLSLGNKIYTDGCGNEVIDSEDFEAKTGRLDFDGDYNTTYCCDIEDCDENEIEIIKDSDCYKSYDLEDWLEKNM